MSKILAANPNAENDMTKEFSIGGNKVEAFVNVSVPQRRAFVSVGPTSAISSNIWSGGQEVSFRLENNIDRIGTAYLKVDIANNSGAACVCAAGPTHIKNIEIYSNNGSTLLYQTNSAVSNFLIDAVCMSRNEWDTSSADRGTDANYSTVSISNPDGQVWSYYYNIAPNFWRTLKLRPYCIDGNLLVKVRFSNQIIQSGTLTTTAANIMISGYYESEKQKNKCIARAEFPKVLSYWAPQAHVETLNLSAGSSYNIRLSGINGWVGQLYFAIRSMANAASVSNQFTFVRPAHFDILNPSSVSLTGFRQQTEKDMILLYSHLYDNLFINKTNACVYSFSQRPVADMATGTCNGAVEMRGDHYLQFTMPAGLGAGAHEVHIFGICNESLSIVKAQARSSRT